MYIITKQYHIITHDISGETKSVAQVLLYVYSNINPFEVRVGDSDEMVWYANPACGG